MRTTKLPYEFLVRWDQQGNLAGAHVQFRFVTTDESGTVIGEFVGPAEPVAAAGANGFPLAAVLTQEQIAAFAGAAPEPVEGGGQPL
ncbi:hypothetical protein J2848_006741 [Azospirillum lipoferum]|uniref:Uncharacterized protein n=1 Tax=Azospirillum lipoferum TaxID=193 RepID=A0A5A9GH09_AZOLI|nr:MULTISPECIES: hypothetical protein [Azospirillum]KAA0593711.1 hypothetical protein FZ942_22720 [Azospirillum lipoferum]MCP1615028.1 hypothetical protein [Azospirillum lipoferum]MDW5536933.1 hypothetical protein [Azospirillum sp. NL1]